MAISLLPFILILSVVVCSSGVIGAIAWQRQTIAGAKAFAILCWAMAWWTFAYIGEMVAPTLEAKLAWHICKSLGIVTMPVALLVFVMAYSGFKTDSTWRTWLVLGIEPAITITMSLMSVSRPLIFRDLHLVSFGHILLLDFTYGPWLWVHIIYLYVIVGVAAFLLLTQFRRSPEVYRWQVALLLISIFVPFLLATIMVLGINPVPGIDLPPFFFLLTNLFLMWGLFRHQLLDLRPVAYELITERMQDGIVMIDHHDRIVAVNEAAATIGFQSQYVGQEITAVFPEWTSLTPDNTSPAFNQEITLYQSGLPCYYELRVSQQLDHTGVINGRLLIFRDITQRRQAEKAIQESESYYRTIFETANTATIIINENKTLALVNHEFENLTGYSRSEIEGNMLWTSFVHHDDLPRMRTYHAMRRRGGDNIPTSYTFKLITRSGDIRHVQIKVALLPDGERSLASLLDITEQIAAATAMEQYNTRLEALIRAATALRYSEEISDMLAVTMSETSQILQAAGISVFLYDSATETLVSYASYPDHYLPNGITYHINEGINGMVARTREIYVCDDLSMDPLAFFNPQEESVASHFKSHLSVPLSTLDQLVGVMHVGRREIRPFTPEEIRFVQSMADLTASAIRRNVMMTTLEDEILARTSEIRAEKAFSDIILGNVADGIAMLDNHLTIQYINDAFGHLTGMSQADVGKWPFPRLLITPDSWELIAGNLATGHKWQGHLQLAGPHKSVLDAAVTIIPIDTLTNDYLGYVVTMVDISQRKALELARNQFMTNVSHELRTPITNIKLHTDLLRAGTPAKKDDYLNVIVKQTERLWHMVEDMLTLTALDSQENQLTQDVIDISQLLATAVLRFQPLAAQKNISLQNDTSAYPLPSVSGSAQNLMLGLAEITQNAIDYTPTNGSVWLKAETAVWRDKPAVAIHISDNGPGIPAQEQPHLFKRFYRGSLGATGHIPGNGLGLSIAHRIIELHQGEITVISQPGSGSQFSIWLPINGQVISEIAGAIPGSNNTQS